MAYSEPSSPDNFYGASYFRDSNILSLQPSATFPIMNGPHPPPVATYSPQYSDPTSASLESLRRTMAAAHAASQHQNFASDFQEEPEPMSNFGEALLHSPSIDDRAQFPATEGLAQFEENHEFSSYDSTYPNTLYSPPTQPRHSPNAIHIPALFHNYSGQPGGEVNGTNVLASFPSQLLSPQSQNSQPTQSQESHGSQSPEESNGSCLEIGFKYEVAESESSNSPLAPSIPFKSPRPPTDLAARRKKAVKPAALTADTLRSRPSLGPRTVSHAESLRRPSDSPISSPMRRVISAGGNRGVLSGRVGKSGIESAQRSPININGFADARAFMDHNYHTTRNPPSLTAGSSLNSSLAPPTPMSPWEREMTLAKRDGSRSSASPVQSGVNFVFNTGVPGCFTSIEDQNLASPPETPQAHVGTHPMGNGWPMALDFQEKQWHFEVPDESLHTPAHDSFAIEPQMPQPSYMSSLSQPVTPALGEFNRNFMFRSESPQYKNDSPQYQHSTQNHPEYSFPDSHYPVGMMSISPRTKQKTFQFSNTTAADFSEK